MMAVIMPACRGEGNSPIPGQFHMLPHWASTGVTVSFAHSMELYDLISIISLHAGQENKKYTRKSNVLLYVLILTPFHFKCSYVFPRPTLIICLILFFLKKLKT